MSAPEDIYWAVHGALSVLIRMGCDMWVQTPAETVAGTLARSDFDSEGMDGVCSRLRAPAGGAERRV